MTSSHSRRLCIFFCSSLLWIFSTQLSSESLSDSNFNGQLNSTIRHQFFRRPFSSSSSSLLYSSSSPSTSASVGVPFWKEIDLYGRRRDNRRARTLSNSHVRRSFASSLSNHSSSAHKSPSLVWPITFFISQIVWLLFL